MTTKPLSRRAATALETLRAGGYFWTGAVRSYCYGRAGGIEIRTRLIAATNTVVKNVGGAALVELKADGYQFTVETTSVGDITKMIGETEVGHA
jgi:hypothetical protein